MKYFAAIISAMAVGVEGFYETHPLTSMQANPNKNTNTNFASDVESSFADFEVKCSDFPDTNEPSGYKTMTLDEKRTAVKKLQNDAAAATDDLMKKFKAGDKMSEDQKAEYMATIIVGDCQSVKLKNKICKDNTDEKTKKFCKDFEDKQDSMDDEFEKLAAYAAGAALCIICCIICAIIGVCCCIGAIIRRCCFAKPA